MPKPKHRASRRKHRPNLPSGISRRAMAGSVCMVMTGAGVVGATTIEPSRAAGPVELDPPAGEPVGAAPVAGFEQPATIQDISGAARYVPPRVQPVAGQSVDAIPAAALAAYQRAETVIGAARPQCHLEWSVLAAVGRVESDHGRAGGGSLGTGGTVRPARYGATLNGLDGRQQVRDTDAGALDGETRWDRTVGPLNFLPTTWTVVGVDSDGDGSRNPQDLDDAALAAAVVLCGNGDDLAKPEGLTRALRGLNHAPGYPSAVITVAEGYTTEIEAVPETLPVVVELPDTTPEPAQTVAARAARPDRDRDRDRDRGPDRGPQQDLQVDVDLSSAAVQAVTRDPVRPGPATAATTLPAAESGAESGDGAGDGAGEAAVEETCEEPGGETGEDLTEEPCDVTGQDTVDVLAADAAEVPAAASEN